jgi:hypothetical protein
MTILKIIMLGTTAKITVTGSLVVTLSSIRSFHQVTKPSGGSEAFRINVSHLFDATLFGVVPLAYVV